MAYIKKEPLCAWLENMGVSDFIIRRIESEAHFPTADVEEVKHGAWLDYIEQGTTVAGVSASGLVGYRCSECGRYEGKKEPYCNCGAKMDGTPKERGGEK